MLTIFPYRQPLVTVVKGVLDIHRHGLGVFASAATIASLDMESINE